MDKNFKKILSYFKKSISKLSGVNLHMTEISFELIYIGRAD